MESVLGKAVNPSGKSLLIPFLCALILSPALMVGHELAHYGAGVWRLSPWSRSCGFTVRGTGFSPSCPWASVPPSAPSYG